MRKKIVTWLLCTVLAVSGTCLPASAQEIKEENIQEELVENEKTSEEITAETILDFDEDEVAVDVEETCVGDGKAQDSAGNLNVAYHTQEEIRAYLKQSGATVNDALTFAVKPSLESPYSAGRLGAGCQEKALAMLNQIRYIAGISYNVTLSDEYTRETQAASLLNYLNDTLSHYPSRPSGVNDELYQQGYSGAGKSNLAGQSWKKWSLNDALVNSWMADEDGSNIDRVGHRRWILNPPMMQTGFGAVSGDNGTYSAVYAFDRQNISATETQVAWPAQNMPLEYFDKYYPWSISMNEFLDKSQITVKLVRLSDNKIWKFSSSSADGDFYVDNGCYGQMGCIIFRPEMNSAEGLGVDTYEVTITGIPSGTLVYNVNFFALTSPVNSITVVDNAYKKKKDAFMCKGDSTCILVQGLPLDSPEDIIIKSSNEKIVKIINRNSEITRFRSGKWYKTIKIKAQNTGTATITASNSKGTIKKSIKITVIDSLAKVKIKKVRAISKKKIKLTWKAVKNAKGYEIYCSTSKNGYYRRIAKVKGKTSYVHKKRKAGKRYYYRIRAYQNTMGDEITTGKYSKVKSVKTKFF